MWWCVLCALTGNYFDWLTSGEYEWPQRCGVCNRSVGTGEGEDAKRAVVRLVCKCLYHRGCLYEELSKKKQPNVSLQDDKVSCCDSSTVLQQYVTVGLNAGADVVSTCWVHCVLCVCVSRCGV